MKGIKKLFSRASRPFLAAAILSLASGCVNVYERFPTTEPKIVDVYQCSRCAAGLTVVASFPQMMSDSPSTSNRLMWENLVSVPLFGLPLAVDTVLEACVDTVLFPADFYLAKRGKGQ